MNESAPSDWIEAANFIAENTGYKFKCSLDMRPTWNDPTRTVILFFEDSQGEEHACNVLASRQNQIQFIVHCTKKDGILMSY